MPATDDVPLYDVPDDQHITMTAIVPESLADDGPAIHHVLLIEGQHSARCSRRAGSWPPRRRRGPPGERVIVLKFGGTSVADAEAIERAASITRSRLGRRPVVVVSALAGTTDVLMQIAEHAASGQLIGALREVEGVRGRHLRAAERLLAVSRELDDVRSELSAHCDELANLAEALSVLGHATPRSQDAIAGYGEQLSSLLIVAGFRASGIDAELIDARQVMITDAHFTSATPQTEAIALGARERILPVVERGCVPVVGGFIGATAQGVPTTLGRGGSDYSASLIGAALGAEVIEIWTDVDGVLTADPRVVDGARLIERIRFDEAAELAAFGAKVLHPSTIAPAVRRGISVFVYNSRRPDGSGTQITARAVPEPVRALAGKGNVTIIKVSSARMLLAHGFLRALFEIFERHRTSVDVVATSEVSVSVTVDDPSRLDALLVDLAVLGDVSVERQRAIIAVVGGALGGSSRTMARALHALGDIAVHMISLSATEINLTLIVNGNDLEPAMRALHAEFFGDGPESCGALDSRAHVLAGP